jgi:hypothetical protein
MRELNIPINPFKSNHLSTMDCSVKSTFNKLKTEYKKQCTKIGSKIHITFREFALQVLDLSQYNHFLSCVGYTDYEQEDVYDTLYNYGFDDNYGVFNGFSVPWKLLIEKLVNIISIKNIIVNSNVKKISIDVPDMFSIYVERNKGMSHFFTKKVIVATSIDSVNKLISSKSPNSIYRQIHGQPFLRVYGKFAKSSIPIMQQYFQDKSIISGPLQKCISMDKDKGVYMICYSDNAHAISLNQNLENTENNRQYYCNLLETAYNIPVGSLVLTSIKSFYWNIGTHYFEPLREPFNTRREFIKKIQHPVPNLLVVGEMASLHQGWVEGALETVDNTILDFIT